MTCIFQQLSHKNQVARIEIEETGKSLLISFEGDEITFDKSAGEDAPHEQYKRLVNVVGTSLHMAIRPGFNCIPSALPTVPARLLSKHFSLLR